MTLLTNNAEGGTNGTTVSIANSGGASGTAWSSVATSGTGTVKYDNTQAAHGSISIRHIATNTSSNAFVQWNITASAAVAVRAYVRFNTLPGVSVFLMTTGGADFIVNAAGKFQISDLNAVQVTFATTISTGVWYRIELENQAGTTTSNGYVAGRYFIGDSTTPVDAAYSSNTRNAGTGVPNGQMNYGQTLANGAVDFWMDDYALADGTTTPIGPIVERLRDARLSAQVLTRTTGSRTRTSRLSAQVLIGPPQKVRDARLSMQVLTRDPTVTPPPVAAPFKGWGMPISSAGAAPTPPTPVGAGFAIDITGVGTIAANRTAAFTRYGVTSLGAHTKFFDGNGGWGATKAAWVASGYGSAPGEVEPMFCAKVHDATAFNDLLAATTGKSWFVFYQEPEDDMKTGSPTIAAYQAAYRSMDTLRRAHAKRANCFLLANMMGFQEVDRHDPAFDVYSICGGIVDVLDAVGSDIYDNSFYTAGGWNPNTYFGQIATAALSFGIPWCVPEFGVQVSTHGVDSSAGAVSRLQTCVGICTADPHCLWMNYWSADPWVSDTLVNAAWAGVLR